MRVAWLSLVDFRSYPTLEWNPDPEVNVLVGDNGSGKTNLLEAIAFLGSLKSFRGARDAEMITDGEESAVLRSGVHRGEGERLIEVEVRRSGGRRAQLDKSPLRRSGQLLGVLRSVWFLPDDLDLVKRGPAYRRDFLDDLAVQLWPGAHSDQAELARALRQRNAFLRQGQRDDPTLDVWDARLAQAGGRVLARRGRVLQLLGPEIDQAYEEIAEDDERVALNYLPSWSEGPLGVESAASLTKILVEALEVARPTDYERRVTTLGPHRDEPSFLLDGHDARHHASQGEQRSIALAARLAWHRLVRDATGESPLLLLDDVFSELDERRAAALSRALPGDTQTLVTSARVEDLPVRGKLWRVGGGKVVE
ncbi:MAG: DNA replication/repair protein RecF [Acidimicrobiia bacterium]